MGDGQTSEPGRVRARFGRLMNGGLELMFEKVDVPLTRVRQAGWNRGRNASRP